MTHAVSRQMGKEVEMREEQRQGIVLVGWWGDVIEAKLAWNCLPSRITKAAIFITCLS